MSYSCLKILKEPIQRILKHFISSYKLMNLRSLGSSFGLSESFSHQVSELQTLDTKTEKVENRNRNHIHFKNRTETQPENRFPALIKTVINITFPVTCIILRSLDRYSIRKNTSVDLATP